MGSSGRPLRSLLRAPQKNRRTSDCEGWNMSRLWRYALVGAVATGAHWALLAVLVEGPGVAAWVASGAGAVLGAQVAFVGNRHYTFDHAGPWWPAWWRFMATAGAGALLGMGVVALGVAAGGHYLLAQAVATGVVMLASFTVNKAWTFRPGP
jgi:putative flippase GtrA